MPPARKKPQTQIFTFWEFPHTLKIIHQILLVS